MTTKRNFLYFIFAPISQLWETLYRLRRFLFNVGFFSRESYKIPIISIGNLTLGGTGKTPLTLWLGKYLNDRDKKVMVLTRGYKGKVEHGTGIIRTGGVIENNPLYYGDEALIICKGLKNASIVVGKKRSENLEYYFESEKPDVVLLDDGHQHLKIDRDLNIVMFDSTLSLDRYNAPPLGYLREGMTALRAADIVVFGRADIVDQETMMKLQSLVRSYSEKDTPFASFYYSPVAIKNINYEREFEPSQLDGMKVVCVSAVASPESFYDLVRKQGAEIVKTYEYPDHHYYKDDEIKVITDFAQENDAMIITTEKDIVKVRRVSDSKNIFYVEILIKFLSGEQELERLVNEILC